MLDKLFRGLRKRDQDKDSADDSKQLEISTTQELNTKINARDASHFLFAFYALPEKFLELPGSMTAKDIDAFLKAIPGLWRETLLNVYVLKEIRKANPTTIQIETISEANCTVISFAPHVGVGNCMYLIIPYSLFRGERVIWTFEDSAYARPGGVLCAHRKGGHSVQARMDSYEVSRVVQTVNSLMNGLDLAPTVAAIAVNHLNDVMRLNADVRQIRERVADARTTLGPDRFLQVAMRALDGNAVPVFGSYAAIPADIAGIPLGKAVQLERGGPEWTFRYDGHMSHPSCRGRHFVGVNTYLGSPLPNCGKPGALEAAHGSAVVDEFQSKASIKNHRKFHERVISIGSTVSWYWSAHRYEQYGTEWITHLAMRSENNDINKVLISYEPDFDEIGNRYVVDILHDWNESIKRANA